MIADDRVRDGHPLFSSSIARVLEKTPIAKWRAYAIVLDVEASPSTKLMLRSELLAWLRNNALDDLALELERTRVVPGALLVLVFGNSGPYVRVLFDPRRGSR